MRVIVVTKKYYSYYNDCSVKCILGITKSEKTADELIYSDKSKDDFPDIPGMTSNEYHRMNNLYVERLSSLEKNEANSPKKNGWIYRFDYNQLSKKERIAYDNIKNAWESAGCPDFSTFYWSHITYKSDMQFYMKILLSFGKYTIDEVKKLDSWFCDKNDPDDVNYNKEYFDVLD